MLASCLPRAVRAKPPARRRVRPSDPGWPTPARWQELGRNVGGNLIRPKPLFAACEGEPGGAACADLTKNLRNPFFIGDQPSGTEVSGWVDRG
jgi:hypothetical protein